MILGQKTSRNNSHCVLNLRCDGANDGTTFTDSSPSGKTVTRVNALTKTAVKKFGTASGYFDGSGDYLTLADSLDWYLSTVNFTIEGWFYMNTLPSSGAYYHLFAQWYTNQAAFIGRLFNVAGTYKLYFYKTTNGSTTTSHASNGISLTTGNWHHFVYVRRGNNLLIYFNGLLAGTFDITGFDIFNSNQILHIGRMPADTTKDYNGYMDSVLFSKGVAKYQRNFLVPSRAA